MMVWMVFFTNKATKQVCQLTQKVNLVLQLLIEDLKINGPAPGKGWPNYRKIRRGKSQDIRHCHLLKGNPTYVCCWKVFKSQKIIEVFYVGTHEKAPY